MRRQRWRPFAPPPRPSAASPGRYCGPVRGAAVPHLITTPASRRSLDKLSVTLTIQALLDKVDRSLTQVSVSLPLPASGNTAGNPPSADRATRAVPLRPAHRAPPCLAAASPGHGVPAQGGRGPAGRRSLAGRIAAARPAIGGAVRSAQGAGRREHALYDNACIIVSCPFPGVLLALRPLRS